MVFFFFFFSAFAFICTRPALSTYIVYLSGLKTDSQICVFLISPVTVYADLGFAELRCWFSLIKPAVGHHFESNISLKFHVKTWKVPSNCPIVCLFVFFCFFVFFWSPLIPFNLEFQFTLRSGDDFSLKVCSFHECDDTQIISMTSDTVATQNQSHTVITALIAF